ncbi:MAG: ROK family transcriptional regulator, partial [Calditrichaeota bacterium]
MNHKDQFIPGNHANVRNINRCVILNVIHRYQPISRVEIAKRIQLTKGTISNIVNELIAEGLVQEISMAESTGGRRPTLLKLASSGVIIGAISIHRDSSIIALGDMEGNVLKKSQLPTIKESAEKFLHQCAEELSRMIEEVPHEKLLGIGVCVPGLVSIDHHHILHTPKLNWNNVAVHLILGSRFDVPIYVENNANAEALARLFFSKKDEVLNNFVHIEVSDGIGVGVVSNQQLLRGTNASSIEFGHTTINEVGEECTCGNRGCWEAYASDWATIRRYNRLRYRYLFRKGEPRKIAPVQGFTAKPILNGIQLDWQESDGSIVKYLIFRGTHADFEASAKSQIAEVSPPPFIDVSIKENTRYFYKLQPINAFGETGELSEAVTCVAPPWQFAFDDTHLNPDEYVIPSDAQVHIKESKFILGNPARESDNIIFKKSEYKNYIVTGRVKPIEVGPYDSAGVLVKVKSEDCWYYALIAYGNQLKEKYNLAFMRRREKNHEVEESWLVFYPMKIDPTEEYTIQVGVFGDWIRMKAWKSREEEPPDWQLSIKDDLGLEEGSVGFRHFGRVAEVCGLKLMPLPEGVQRN